MVERQQMLEEALAAGPDPAGFGPAGAGPAGAGPAGLDPAGAGRAGADAGGPAAVPAGERGRPLSFAELHRTYQRLHTRVFSALLRPSFASFAPSARVQHPLRLDGERRISIGTNVFIASNCWLATYEVNGHGGELEIGEGTRITGYCVLAAAARVTLGRSVLLARNVYIADHRHAYEDVSLPVSEQGFAGIAPVEICDGAWLGQNVVVAPGVRIGRGAVIGANSFVREDVDDHCVAVGAPARVVRRFAPPAS
ncbi:MAG TPA: acyltransferase [Solirubrobacteraceae bacterium]|nr:acyltransferase [Solirubrobacteraceae bacterium]